MGGTDSVHARIAGAELRHTRRTDRAHIAVRTSVLQRDLPAGRDAGYLRLAGQEAKEEPLLVFARETLAALQRAGSVRRMSVHRFCSGDHPACAVLCLRQDSERTVPPAVRPVRQRPGSMGCTTELVRVQRGGTVDAQRDHVRGGTADLGHTCRARLAQRTDVLQHRLSRRNDTEPVCTVLGAARATRQVEVQELLAVREELQSRSHRLQSRHSGLLAVRGVRRLPGQMQARSAGV